MDSSLSLLLKYSRRFVDEMIIWLTSKSVAVDMEPEGNIHFWAITTKIPSFPGLY